LTEVEVLPTAVEVKVKGKVDADCYIYAGLNFGEALYIDTGFATDNKFGKFEIE